VPADRQIILRLNDEYIRAFLEGDAAWYDKHLAHDFKYISGSGAVVDRSTFLQLTAAGSGFADYELHDVTVRIYGGTALIQALGVFKRPDGASGRNRYTDVYVRDDGTWKVVSAQVTPVTDSQRT
jgi:ketosteroid isomerase-like protein